MLICAIDTSGREGSVALVRYTGATEGVVADNSNFEILKFVPLAGGTYSAELIPTISRVLESQALPRTAIDLFAVASGPGSFTGLRVGLSTVKALGDALQKPIAAVSVLQALAIGTRRTGRVIAALDAQRGEVFVGEYDIAASASGEFPLRVVHEALSTVDDFTTWLSARIPVPTTWTPDATIDKRVRESGSPAELVARPAADLYARVGLMKFLAGETVTPEELDANYIRRSDAEILSAPKLGIPLK